MFAPLVLATKAKTTKPQRTQVGVIVLIGRVTAESLSGRGDDDEDDDDDDDDDDDEEYR